MESLSVDLPKDMVLKIIAEYLEKKYHVHFATVAFRPCYDNGIGCSEITGYTFIGKTQ